ncbi:unnamed protein product [Knipowitschia caucasica]|uniref:Uncharacterized protein n=1 Tax=Knipowitschia caucasica TaxID=637954 RepID=A0AAV2MMG3_KNICA
MISLYPVVIFLYGALHSGSSLGPQMQHRRLLQTSPHEPLKVWWNGEPCVLLWFRRLSLGCGEQRLDLTERVFSAHNPVDLSQSSCSPDQARVVLRFGDMKDLTDLSISLFLSRSQVEASGEGWFSLDSVCVQFNSSQKLVFNSSQIYSPESSSFSCEHISSLQKYNALLSPTGRAHNWALTFTHFQIQAFSVSSGVFSRPVDCETFLTPALLMGLLSSLILLLVLAYAFHLLLHLRDLEEREQSCQQSPGKSPQHLHCSAQKYVL